MRALVLSLGREDPLGVGGNGYALQYPCLENPMDRGASRAIVHGVAESQTQLNDFQFTSLQFVKFRKFTVKKVWSKESTKGGVGEPTVEEIRYMTCRSTPPSRGNEGTEMGYSGKICGASYLMVWLPVNYTEDQQGF